MRWTLAALLVMSLFWFPIVNGAAAGVFGAWHEDEPPLAGWHALGVAFGVAPLLWMLGLYPLVWQPFAQLDPILRVALSLLPMPAAAVLTAVVRTSRRARIA